MKAFYLLLMAGSAAVTARAQNELYVQNGAVLTVNAGETLTVNGGLHAAAGSSIANNGTITLNNNPSANAANWTDNSAAGVLSGNGWVVFNSTGAQSISGPTQFYNLETNNGGLTLADHDLNITNSLQLTAGVLQANGYAVKINNTAAGSVTTGSANTNFAASWINGTIWQAIAPNTTYELPTGNGSVPQPAQFLSNNLAGVNYIKASFGPKPGTDAGMNVAEGTINYTTVNNGGVWYIDSDVAPTGGTYGLKLFTNGFTGLLDNGFAIVSRQAASAAGSDWQVPAGSSLNPAGGAGRMVGDGYAQRNNISPLGRQFGIGQVGTVLPVRLYAFNGRKEGTANRLFWKTASETNTAYFNVERSGDGATFSSLGRVAATGNSTAQKEYSLTDAAPLAGSNYYRLQMVDEDGRFTYSGVILLNGQAGARPLALLPNPVQADLKLHITSQSAKDATILVTDATGRLLASWKRRVQAGSNLFVMDARNLASGAYTLTAVYSDGQHQSIHFIKAQD